MFEAVGETQEIRVDQKLRTLPIAGMHTGLGRAFDHEIDGTDGLQVFERADVAMHERHSPCPKARKGQFAAQALQVVERDDLRLRKRLLPTQRKARTDEPRPARDQDPAP